MPTNTNNVIIGYGLNTGAVWASGAFLGMPIDAMILGAIGGALMLGLNKPSDLSRAVSTILASIVFAGAFSPIVAAFLLDYINIGSPEDEILLIKSIVPIAIGGGWMWALPRIVSKIEKTWHEWWNVWVERLIEKHQTKKSTEHQNHHNNPKKGDES